MARAAGTMTAELPKSVMKLQSNENSGRTVAGLVWRETGCFMGPTLSNCTEGARRERREGPKLATGLILTGNIRACCRLRPRTCTR